MPQQGEAFEEERPEEPVAVRRLTLRQNLARLGAATTIVFLVKGLVWLAVAGAVLWR